MDLGHDFPRMDDDDLILPTAEPFPAMIIQGGNLRTASSEARQEDESSESAEARLPRKPRAPRELPVDERQELHNADLADWKANYADNMSLAVEAKKNHKAPSLAKKNAAFWVVGAGIGGVGTGLGISKLQSPLDMFAGDSMMEALTGFETTMAGLKRGREGEEDLGSDSEARRVRMRDGESDQIGRGDGLILNEDEGAAVLPAEEVRHGHHHTPIKH